MESIGRFLTALALIVSLLLGAAGGASAHALMTDHSVPATHHDQAPCASHDDQAPPVQTSDHEQHHAMPMAAQCCPGLAAPTRLDVTRVVILRRVAWHPAAAHLLATRPITPEPPPPKSVV